MFSYLPENKGMPCQCPSQRQNDGAALNSIPHNLNMPETYDYILTRVKKYIVFVKIMEHNKEKRIAVKLVSWRISHSTFVGKPKL